MDAISGDLNTTGFVDNKKLKPKFGRRRIELELDKDTLEWAAEIYGKKVRGKVQPETIQDLSSLGVIPQPDDPKFYDALKLFITRAVIESGNICSGNLDWDDDEEKRTHKA